jgi:hypothetical protein
LPTTCIYSIQSNLVAGNVRLATIEGAQGEAALLQLGLGIVPLLGEDELLQAREEANLAEKTHYHQHL